MLGSLDLSDSYLFDKPGVTTRFNLRCFILHVAMSATRSDVVFPQGRDTVNVKLINPVNFGPAQIHRFMSPPVPGLETFQTSPSLCFLIEHPSGRSLVWDLGIRKDHHNYAPNIRDYLPTTKYHIEIERDLADILKQHDIDGADIEAVIWR